MRDQAADWFARLRGGATDPADLASFEAWLDADPRHRAAFDQVARSWDQVGSLGESAEIRVMRRAALDADAIDSATPVRRRRWHVAASIAALALLLGSGLAWRERVDERHLATGKGDVRAVQLADGSEVTLDADTELVARVTPLSRTVEIVRGQALFRVAPERFRPFEVEAERVTARARGTVYAVALRPNEVMIAVQEGSVEVRDEIGPYVTELGPSQLLSVVRNTRVRALRRDVDGRSFAWLRGKLDVDGQKLRDVIDEVNRYVERPILIADSDLGDLPVSGVFDPRRPDNFLDALTQIRPITIERTKDGNRRIARRR